MGLATTSAIGTGHSVGLGALTMGYAGSSLMGYFASGHSPILTAFRANINAPILSVSFLVSMVFGGFNLGLVALMVLLMFDGFEGMTERSYQTPGDTQIITPVTSFFMESWRNNGWSNSKAANRHTFQFGLLFSITFFTLICGAEGLIPISMIVMIITYVLASMYAFFNPVQITAINTLQSNAAQVALVGGSTVCALAGSAGGIPFYMLYLLMCADTVFSNTEFVGQVANRVSRANSGVLTGTKDDMYENLTSR